MDREQIFAKQFIIPLIVALLVTMLLIRPHSGQEYDGAPGTIVIGLLLLSFMMIFRQKILWIFTLNRIQGLSRAIQGKK